MLIRSSTEHPRERSRAESRVCVVYMVSRVNSRGGNVLPGPQGAKGAQR